MVGWGWNDLNSGVEFLSFFPFFPFFFSSSLSHLTRNFFSKLEGGARSLRYWRSVVWRGVAGSLSFFGDFSWSIYRVVGAFSLLLSRLQFCVGRGREEGARSLGRSRLEYLISGVELLRVWWGWIGLEFLWCDGMGHSFGLYHTVFFWDGVGDGRWEMGFGGRGLPFL